jgi:hypothetical protein
MSPWTYRKCGCGDPICSQYTISVQGSVGFELEDARLIAAAPDLLAALEKIAAVSMSGGNVATKLDEARTVARYAIRKARGE